MSTPGGLVLPTNPDVPFPSLFAPVVEVGGGRYTAGLHPSAEGAQAAGDALADIHPSLVMRGVVELLPAWVVAQLASAYDELQQLGGAA
ncbi:hypothetical protein FDG2_1885 [Candidatus Protofrankia californiensis]|uniref:Uncharacterized protein n=1 Tax=Candidatus Protofrankia californiensis TaxID=1839754 RepID=A0A1C3NWI7_9ACTN|nr:hypothetical protein FDG2_1885 [Candidatus Protofrankia californiensis]